jgi:hypothetical protein
MKQIDFKPNNRVLILDHKDNTNPKAIDETGTLKLIRNVDDIDLYYIHMDNDIGGAPYNALDIPQGHTYIAVYEELALIE